MWAISPVLYVPACSQSPSDKVISYSPQMEEELESVSFPSFTSVLPIPGLLLVHTPSGLSLLHPGMQSTAAVYGRQSVCTAPELVYRVHTVPTCELRDFKGKARHRT